MSFVEIWYIFTFWDNIHARRKIWKFNIVTLCLLITSNKMKKYIKYRLIAKKVSVSILESSWFLRMKRISPWKVKSKYSLGKFWRYRVILKKVLFGIESSIKSCPIKLKTKCKKKWRWSCRLMKTWHTYNNNIVNLFAKKLIRNLHYYSWYGIFHV